MTSQNQTTYHYWRNQDLFLNIYAVPRTKKDRIVGAHGAKLKIQIAAPANDGKANQRLIKFLAATFAVPQNRVEIIKGECAQYKLVKVCQPQSIPTELERVINSSK